MRTRAGPLLHLVDRALELLVGEGLDPAAGVAHEVVVVLTALVPRLEARAPGARVDALDEALVDEQVEHAVDARDADGPAGLSQAVVHLLRRQAALLLGEETDHRVARSAASMAGGAKDVVCVLGPGHLVIIAILIII